MMLPVTKVMEPGLEIGRSSLPCLQLIGFISHPGQLGPAEALVHLHHLGQSSDDLHTSPPAPPLSSDGSPPDVPESACTRASVCTVC